MRPTNEEEIKQKIKAMKDNKALGPNSIPTNILNRHSKTLSGTDKPFFKSRQIPNNYETAKFISIEKRGDKIKYDNYRPISLTSNISRLIEKW